MNDVIQKKICLLGCLAVGKTSLVRRFVENKFDERYLSTIGVSISRKEIGLQDGKMMRFVIWDLAGSEKYTGAQTSYIQGASGGIIVFDLTRPSIMSCLEKYYHRMLEASPKAAFVFVGNKLDLVTDIEWRIKEPRAFAEACGAPFFLTSAKTGEHVEEVFTTLADLLFAQQNHGTANK